MLEMILEIDQLCGQLVQVPMGFRVAVDGEPGAVHGIVRLMNVTPISLRLAGIDTEAAARQQQVELDGIRSCTIFAKIIPAKGGK